MALNKRKHTVPAATENPSRVAIIAGFESVNDIVPVADTTERATVASAVAPTASRPLFVYRADAVPGRRLEVTENGSTWDAVQAGSPPGAELLRSAGVDLGNNSLQNQGFGSGDVVSDVGGYYSGTGVASLTVPANHAGLHLISVGSGISGGPVVARFFLVVLVNGVEKFRANGYGDDSAHGSRTVRLAAGDTIGVAAFQNGGSTRQLSGLALTAHRIGP